MAAAFSPLPSRGDRIPPLARLIGPGGSLRRGPFTPCGLQPAGPRQVISQLFKLSQKFDQDLVGLPDKVLGVLSARHPGASTTTQWPWCCRPSPPYPSNQSTALHQGRRPEVAVIVCGKMRETLWPPSGWRSWMRAWAFFGLGRRVCYWLAF